jgi:uncharacterized membrane protein YhaH (DUF805 family)
MEKTSPYAPPEAELQTETDTYGSIDIFSSRGRIGRLRYITYTIGVTLFCYLITGALSGLVAMTMAEERVGFLIALIFAIGLAVMLFMIVILTIQRCHDFNMSGLLSLSLLIPLLPFIFWFVPGSKGANRFGPRPPPNRGVVFIVVIILLMVVVLGILAAIAIPAYQDYLTRAATAGV